MPDNKDNKNDNMDNNFDDIFQELLGKSKEEYLNDGGFTAPKEKQEDFSWDKFELDDILKDDKAESDSAEMPVKDEPEMSAEDFFAEYKKEESAIPVEKIEKAPEKKFDTGPDDFDIKFDFDNEYKDRKEDDDPPPIRPNREKRSGCLGGLMYFAFVVGISAIIACLGWVAATDVLALGKPDGIVEVTVPDEFTMDEVTNILYDKGLIKYKFLFNIYSDFSSAEGKISGGTYQLNTNYDYRALVNGMTESGGTLVEVSVTIPEGYTMSQIFDLLVENQICDKEELIDTAKNTNFNYFFLDSSTLGNEKRLEGYLFPDTYDFYVNDDPETVIDKMLANFDSKITDEYKAQAEERGYTIPEIIKVASLIEREAGSDEERATIASVIYNRLENSDFQYLQLDSTINYAIADSGAPFSADYDSPYNTYLYPGLPAGAISNPGIASIEAALYPDDTSYYYFALSTAGVHEFFEYYDYFAEFLESENYAG